MNPSLQMQLCEPLVFTYMAIIVAFINIYQNNQFAKGNWPEKKMLTSLLDNKTIVCDDQLFSFFQNLI